MKFAFVITNLKGGGAEKAFLKIATLLSLRGHLVTMILLENSIEHAYEPLFDLQILQARRGFLGKRRAAKRLKKMVEGCDVVISTLPYADEILHLAHVPNTWHRIANTLSEEIKELRGRKAKRRYERYKKIYQQAGLIAVSQGVAEDLKETFHCKKVMVLPNPFDPIELNRCAAEESVCIPNEPYILHVGRFVPQKRHDLLFEALQTIPKKCVLLTQPSKKLEALIEQFGVQEKVIVAGFQKNPYPWIKKAELLVLCSDREGLPNVLIEAMLLGTPVVSTDCKSGPKEILDGTLVPCGDAIALREALLRPQAKPKDLSRYLPERIALGYEALI